MHLFLQPRPSPPERARPARRKGETGARGQPRGPRPPPGGAPRRRDVSAVSGGRRAGGAGGAPARPPGPSCCARGPGAGGAPRSSAAAREVGPGAPPPPPPAPAIPAIPPFLGSEVRVGSEYTGNAQVDLRGGAVPSVVTGAGGWRRLLERGGGARRPQRAGRKGRSASQRQALFTAPLQAGREPGGREERGSSCPHSPRQCHLGSPGARVPFSPRPQALTPLQR